MWATRLTHKGYPDSTGVDYTHDAASRLTNVSDPTGTYQFSFDNMGRLTATTTDYSFLTSRSFTNAYAYDAGSNRTSFTDPESGATSYVYDTLNRLTTLTPPPAISSGSFGFSYDALGRRTQLTRPNSVNTSYTYDNLSRLLSVLHTLNSATIDGASYTVDAVGNRTAKTNQLSAVTESYGYDAIYQLTGVTQGATTTESYTYDPVGNRLSSLGVSPYSYNNSNQLTSTPGATYTYDNNGNTLTKADASGTTTYAWDFENRLVSVSLPGSGGTVSFKYDPFGRRVQKASVSSTTNYAYDGADVSEEVDSSGSPVARYAMGPGIDQPLAMLRAGVTSYYQADGLGSITSLTDASGGLAATYTYDGFGKPVLSSGSLVNPFRYTARELDSETGLYYYRARYYDPDAGRFLGEDPMGFIGGADFFTYVNNNTPNLVDNLGLKPWDKQRCAQRMVQLVARAGTFLANFAKYNPVTDGAGGWPWKNVKQGTSGVAKAGSHFNSLRELQDSIRRKLKEYEDNCSDTNGGPTPPCVKEAAEKVVPAPYSPPTNFEIQRMIDSGNYGEVGWGAVGVAAILGLDLATGGGSTAPTAPLLRWAWAF